MSDYSEDSFAALLQDLGDEMLDYFLCLVVAPLSSLSFWIFVVSTLFVKQQAIWPRLEQYFKTTYVTRERTKRRRLRDTLKDPILVASLERQLLRKNDGDKQKVQDTIDRLRTRAEEEVSSEDDTKGEEKIMAADALWKGSIAISILLLCMCNLLPAFDGKFTASYDHIDFGWWISSPRSYSSVKIQSTLIKSRPDSHRFPSHDGYQNLQAAEPRRRLLGTYTTDWCADDLQGFALPVQCILFCMIHLVHTYVMTRNTPRRSKRGNGRNRSTPASDGGREEGLLSDAEQPLLRVEQPESTSTTI